MQAVVRSLSWSRAKRRSPRLPPSVTDIHTVDVQKVRRSAHLPRCDTGARAHLRLPCVQMPGSSRVGIGVKRKHGVVNIVDVVPGGPSALHVAVGDVLVEVNGTAVGKDAGLAQRLILTAVNQSTTTGQLMPVRLTLGTLELPSPKSVDDDLDFSLDLEMDSDQSGGGAQRREVVQTL